jgi:hypothetical protein
MSLDAPPNTQYVRILSSGAAAPPDALSAGEGPKGVVGQVRAALTLKVSSSPALGTARVNLWWGSMV